ncbi:MAG: InlB B-repeat-containing protein, partial [Firmicutes bacterium]|nr:InlB B-repeat-containing protein [Bacillota bacterium]
LSTPIEPTREGYTFIDWYSDSELTTLYDFTSEVTSNMTIYAKWDKIELEIYTIMFDTNGGTQISSVLVEENHVFSTPIEPTREGYTFIDWYSDSELTTLYDFTSEVTSHMTIYVKWEVNQYTINYNIFSDEIILGTSIVLDFDETLIQFESGRSHTAALTSDYQLFVWGSNSNGQLGNGTITYSLIPLDITSEFNLGIGETIVLVKLGDFHSAVLTSLGRVFLWGGNNYGQLGNGTQIDQLTPLDITSEFNLNPSEMIVSIELGANHSAALTSSGRIFIWGCNWSGRLGNNSDIDSSVPIDITNQFNLDTGDYITVINLGGVHSSALTSNSRLFMWGEGGQGTIGNGTYEDSNIPLEITDRFGLGVEEQLVSISMGETHSSALTSNHRLFVWGSGDFGELGEPGSWQHINPFEITSEFHLVGNEKIAFIEMGHDFSSAITLDGRVFTWGFNSSGQLGDETVINKDYPVEISSSFQLYPNETIIKLSLGYGFSSALSSEGRIFLWGSNSEGQLGNNTVVDELKPSKPVLVFYKMLNSRIYDYSANIDEYVPILDGYTFDGWYIDESLATLYLLGEMPSENITLYGQWIAE